VRIGFANGTGIYPGRRKGTKRERMIAKRGIMDGNRKDLNVFSGFTKLAGGLQPPRVIPMSFNLRCSLEW
jgi:hypothetical protein